MPLDYERKYVEKYRSNVNNAPEAVKRGELDKKINHFCKLHGFVRDEVKDQIKTNRIVAACFAKNPNKQNFYERAAGFFIKNIDGITDFELLPTNSLGVFSGAVMSKSELKERGGYAQAKTIDFRWRYRGFQFYAGHKYTKQEGGSQGNQYKDLQRFITEALPCSLSNVRFLAIADGEFYNGANGQAGMSRIEHLKSLASNGRVFACTINDIEELLPQIVDSDGQ